MSLLLSLNRFVVKLFYRLDIEGAENIPADEGALLVSNHASFVDANVLLAAFKRPIRFLIYKPIYDLPVVKPWAKAMGAIPVDAGSARSSILGSLEDAQKAINDGELVCIFAEGAITRHGNMLPFAKGIERIASGINFKIIPIYIDSTWGSMFSFKGGPALLKFPKKIPLKLRLQIGVPLPPDSSRFKVRQRVQELGAMAFMRRDILSQTLGQRFLKMVKKSPFAPAVSDSLGLRLSRWKLLVAAYCFAKKFDTERAKTDPEKVAIVLPSCVPGAIANVAMTLMGKVSVNLNFTLGLSELQLLVDRAGVKRIISSNSFLKKFPDIKELAEKQGCELYLIEDSLKSVSTVEKLSAICKLLLPFQLAQKLLISEAGRGSSHDTATVLFSSGSTSLPKGVQLSHVNLCSNIDSICEVLPLSKSDVIFGSLPYFHSFGLNVTLWMPLLRGIHVTYHTNPLESNKVASIVRDEQATVLLSTPTFLMNYVRRIDQSDFSSLKYVVVGSEKLKKEYPR